ncbi:cryptochrome/photolyase family protein [Burkholderia glumae]|uniref:cryptochrome/photolyase family protein n=1 Tax=Burkholderia glumae TaxID=337 RepID=UPI0002E46BC2|nr:cryptochrome/photolyase family protein [Burkholderia glumae]MCQ0033415.1 cryptochrome/photolyase family protein [Burkholderia glumae]MCQ0039545.1 cryptochrome/photolyase family protein [Burkholderia glumae]PJO21202.1 cryptochrome/photolyase family protein [Burkholderia glumae AU6208]QHE13229.1 cryptochrome/photolyase family protein [Burkholderia glumae AU6208]QJW82110.1 cryptochrome/photolyase family protein [Burkholderia glumae]
MTTLRLILGDQLDPNHPWFAEVHADTSYVLMEVRQETDYTLHHAQKILAIFAAMRRFGERLRDAGHRVHYLEIDDPRNRQAIPANLDLLAESLDARRIEYLLPDEWRLDQQLRAYAAASAIPVAAVDTGHFYTTRDALREAMGAGRPWVMDRFYRAMRVRHRILLDADGAPAGGRWNYDADNRQAWSGQPPEPADWRPRHDHRELWARIEAAGVRSFGKPSADDLRWPVDRDEALACLDRFIRDALPWFGQFQDAMHTSAPRLFHSMLSFALNVKMLDPREVVARAEAAYRAGAVPLAAAEGFIRQILGWREFVRGVYWARMPDYARSNGFGHRRALPDWFWNGNTRMACMSHALQQSLDHAHAHHIQRLMVIGNFALLAGLDPQAVHAWYLGVYIDAFEWVEMPNTLGMSQYADGGAMATKPYVSSAAYLHRMSDYCRGCAYDHRARTGDGACPFNALYWDFFDRHRDALRHNHRLAMVYRQLARFDEEALQALRAQAARLRDGLASL